MPPQARPCHRCRGTDRAGRADVRQSGTGAFFAAIFYAGLLQHLCRADRLWGVFHTLLPRIPYPALAAFFAAASMLIANLGLADILRLSVPVLNALYPVAIVLITLSSVPGLEQRRRVYPLCIGCTAVQNIAAALPLGPLFLPTPCRWRRRAWLVLPAVIGLLAGIF